ncbi:MAG: DUF4037 domain-containing protein [Pedococcus sp.]
MELSGAELSRDFYETLIAPSIALRWPDLPHAAGLLGGGSEVLGLDDAMSRDHDWGLRLNLIVAPDMIDRVDAHLGDVLPESYLGRPIRFATTRDPHPRHRVRVEDPESFVASRTGVVDTNALSVRDWLSLTGQAVLEVTAGPLFVDTSGQLSAARRALTWYPQDLWVHVVATDWTRIAQELPFVGRTADRGDDLGSRVVTARLADAAMHLAHLLERRWPPYAKWAGTSLAHLPHGQEVAEPLLRALGAGDWRIREDALVDALRSLNRLQHDAGLPTVDDPVEPFFERPYQGVREDVVTLLEASVTDPAVRSLPRGVGSAEQWSHNVDVLVDPVRRRALPSD